MSQKHPDDEYLHGPFAALRGASAQNVTELRDGRQLRPDLDRAQMETQMRRMVENLAPYLYADTAPKRKKPSLLSRFHAKIKAAVRAVTYWAWEDEIDR